MLVFKADCADWLNMDIQLLVTRLLLAILLLGTNIRTSSSSDSKQTGSLVACEAGENAKLRAAIHPKPPCSLHAYLVYSKNCHPCCSCTNCSRLLPEVQNIQWLQGVSQAAVHASQKAVVAWLVVYIDTRVQHA